MTCRKWRKIGWLCVREPSYLGSHVSGWSCGVPCKRYNHLSDYFQELWYFLMWNEPCNIHYFPCIFIGLWCRRIELFFWVKMEPSFLWGKSQYLEFMSWRLFIVSNKNRFFIVAENNSIQFLYMYYIITWPTVFKYDRKSSNVLTDCTENKALHGAMYTLLYNSRVYTKHCRSQTERVRHEVDVWRTS